MQSGQFIRLSGDNKSPVDKFLGKVNGTLDRVHDLLSGVIK